MSTDKDFRHHRRPSEAAPGVGESGGGGARDVVAGLDCPSGTVAGDATFVLDVKQLLEIACSGQHLLAFEIAARHRSFKRAAAELGVTPPVVGRLMRELEASLGVTLFERRHRSVAPTEAADVLYEAVRGGYEQMYSVARRLRGGALTHVNLLCTAAHVHWYVLPRFEPLQARHPDVALRIQVIDRYRALEPEGPEGAVLGIWSGERPRPGYECVEIALEEVYPVCNPRLEGAIACGDDLEALAREPLLSEEDGIVETVLWEDFFAAFGIAYRAPDTGLSSPYYEPLLQAAIAGQGVVLARSHLSQGPLREGLLTRIGTLSWRSGRRYWLVWPDRTSLSAHAELVRDALLAPLETSG